MINFSTEKLNSQCEVSQQQSQLGPRMVTINSLFSKRLQKILSFYLYFLRAIRCISIKFYKSHCIKLNKYTTDLGGQKRGGKKKRWSQAMKNIDHPHVWCQLLSFVVFSTHSSVQLRWVCWCAVYRATALRHANCWEASKGVNKSVDRGGSSLWCNHQARFS